MSLIENIKIEEDTAVEEDQHACNPNDDRSQENHSTIRIKEEPEVYDDEEVVDNFQSQQNEFTFDNENETYPDENIQIKDEITIEEAKISMYSEFEQQRLKLKCKLCDYRCHNQTILWNHNRDAHSEETTTRCLICYEKFKGTFQLEKHIEDQHQGLGNRCNICLAQYKKGEVQKHKEQCPGQMLFICKSCEKQYLRKEGLFKHLDEHGIPEGLKESSINELRVKDQFYSCDICKDDMAYKIGTLREHGKEQHDGYYLNCPDCGQTFNNTRNRRVHIQKYCKVGPARERFNGKALKCTECSKICKNRVALEDHIKANHSKKTFYCNLCKIQFSNSGVFRYHNNKYHTEPSSSCPYCPEKFNSKAALFRHTALHENKSQNFLCKFCDFRCGNQKKLLQHEKNTHPKECTARCTICYSLFTGISQLENHITDEHQGLAKKCEICLAQYEKSTQHKTSCTGRLLFVCDSCEILFVKKEGLLKHLEVHGIPEDLKESSISETSIKEQFFSCDICRDDRAYRHGHFKEHAKDQHGDHYFLCPDCKQTFKHSRTRDRHVQKYCKVGPARERLNEAEVKCPECSKICKNRIALMDHMDKSHSLKKTFQCKECKMTFSKPGALSYHKVKCHKEPSFSCSYCSKKFCFESTLLNHVASHEK